jgi:hypothetical protein
MRKNKAMRTAALLLVLVLMTSCFVGGTFAKYTTTASGTAEARVAYWGFDAEAEMTLDLFAADYTDVKGAENVIAPGTGKTAEFGFAYTANGELDAPEVDYAFTVEATGTCGDEIKANPNIQWYVDSELAEDPAGTAAEGSFDAMLAQLNGMSEATIKAGNLPAAFSTADATHTVSWVWAFETLNGNTADADQDKLDTDMGNATSLDEVTLTITVSAVQLNTTAAPTP